MNKLMIEKDYNTVVNLFEKQLPYFTVQNSSTKSFQTSVPMDQIGLVFQALLFLNSIESFNKLKEIIKFIDSRQAKLSNKGLARAVLLSIQQVYKLYMKWYPFLSICLLNTQK
jgi:hypothetical protein